VLKIALVPADSVEPAAPLEMAEVA